MSSLNVNTISEYTSANGVTIDGVLIKDGNVDGVDVSAITQGITSTDQYDITSNVTSVTQPITNWARNTQTLQGNINAGVTVSSGIFTFPSTGYWLINAYATINITTGSPAYLTASFKSSNDNFSSEDCVIILRTFLIKLKRLIKLHQELRSNNTNIDMAVASFKPPIFWKEKEVVKKQIKSFNYEEAKELIVKTNEIEIIVKRNPQSSLNITTDFVISQTQ